MLELIKKYYTKIALKSHFMFEKLRLDQFVYLLSYDRAYLDKM